MPDPGRSPDVSTLTSGELERTRRELQAALALARPGSPARTPILAHVAVIDAELAGRPADLTRPPRPRMSAPPPPGTGYASPARIAAQADPSARDDLTSCLFRALFQGFDLHRIGGTYVVLPKGTPCLSGPSLGAIARQISTRPNPAPGPGTGEPDR